RDHYSVHRPVIITGMMEDWPALKKWTPAYFKDNFGELEVEIQAKRTTNSRYEIDQPRHAQRVRFADFIDQVVTCGESNDVYMTANNSTGNSLVLSDLWNDVVQFPEYLDAGASQRGFFWFGPAGTITPLHHDLTNNFMAQVHGRKLVKLVAAEDVAYLYNHLHCYTEVDFSNIDYEKFPLMREVRVIECELAPG